MNKSLFKSLGHMTKMAAMTIYCKPLKITISDDLETLHLASGT